MNDITGIALAVVSWLAMFVLLIIYKKNKKEKS